MVKHEGTTQNPILLSFQGIMLSNSVKHFICVHGGQRILNTEHGFNKDWHNMVPHVWVFQNSTGVELLY